MSDTKTVVIDNGTGILKAGFGGESAPRTFFKSYLGYPKYGSIQGSDNDKNQYIGDEATQNSSFLITRYSMERGIVTNWDDMERIWKYTYEKLGVNSSEHPVLLTEASLNPKANREKMVQLMFETFNVPSFYVCNQCFLSLYSSQRTTGVVCEVGEGVTQIMPIINNKYVDGGASRLEIGGRDITEHLQDILRESGYYFTTTEEFELVRSIKEKTCYVALDYDKELYRANSTYDVDIKCTLPDGNYIEFSNQRFRAPEILFNPQFAALEVKRIQEKIIESIEKCDVSSRKDLFSNIILSGGTTTLKGFPEHVEKEVTNWAPLSMEVKVIATPRRRYAVWRGGSILTQVLGFKDMPIKRQEYNEGGHTIVHRKCF